MRYNQLMKFHFTSSVVQKLLHYIHKSLFVYLSRLTSEFRLILPIALFVVLLLNTLTPKSQLELSKEAIQQNPAGPKPHLFLAQQLFVTNQFVHAQTEAKLADNTEMLQKIQEAENQSEDVQKQVIFWQKVVRTLPNYRDGYLKLAILNWKLYRPFEAKKYLDIALGLDPNNEVVKKLFREIK